VTLSGCPKQMNDNGDHPRSKGSTRIFPVSCRPWGTSLRRVHLFSALLSFEKGGKPVVNLPMEWVFSFSAEVSTRTSNSCAVWTVFIFRVLLEHSWVLSEPQEIVAHHTAHQLHLPLRGIRSGQVRIT